MAPYTEKWAEITPISLPLLMAVISGVEAIKIFIETQDELQ